MKEDKNRKFINYVVDHLVADTKRGEFPGIIDPPFISGVETTSLYTDLAHVQEWKTRQYDSFVEYVKDIYGVIDKELALVWNLYGRRYMNLYDSEEMLREEVSAKDVHDAADEAGIPWDNDKKFMKLSKEVTGKEHIDDMTTKERKKLIKTILKEETMDHPFLGPGYESGGEEFFTVDKGFLDRIVGRLMKESYFIDEDALPQGNFFYGWAPHSPPHVAPELLGARHYTWLRNHLRDIYDITVPEEIDYIWGKYYRKLLRKYAR